MNRRQLSISDIASLYSGVKVDLLEADPEFTEVRCASCGAVAPEQGDELFLMCTSCGRVVGDLEDQIESDG